MRGPLFSLLFTGAERRALGAVATVTAAIATVTVAAAAATVAAITLAALGTAHHRRRAGFMRVDADGEETDDVLVDIGLALELGDRRGRGIDVEHDVMRFAVLGDAVGEAAQAPGFGLGDLPAIVGEDFG